MAGSLLGRVKSGYVPAARAVGRLLTALRLLDAEPPPRERRTLHWLHSLTRVHDAAAMVDLDVPWWTYRAIDEVERWLQTRSAPARVFEYGAGASTVWLARRSGEVVSVEHDVAFADRMHDLLAPLSNVTLLVRPPVASPAPEVPSHKEGFAGQDFAAYVAAIDEVAGAFDLVVIDGRAREACLLRALPRLADNAIVVVDNTRRRRYRRAIEAAPVVELRLPGLTPTLPYPDQTSLVRPV